MEDLQNSPNSGVPGDRHFPAVPGAGGCFPTDPADRHYPAGPGDVLDPSLLAEEDQGSVS